MNISVSSIKWLIGICGLRAARTIFLYVVWYQYWEGFYGCETFSFPPLLVYLFSSTIRRQLPIAIQNGGEAFEVIDPIEFYNGWNPNNFFVCRVYALNPSMSGLNLSYWFSPSYLCVTELLFMTFRQIQQFILVVIHFILSDTFRTRWSVSCKQLTWSQVRKVFSLTECYGQLIWIMSRDSFPASQ